MIDWILRSSVDNIKEEGVKVIPRKSSRYPASYVTDREFADDLAATSTTPQGLQELITAISTTSAAAANLKMNVTKCMMICTVLTMTPRDHSSQSYPKIPAKTC